MNRFCLGKWGDYYLLFCALYSNIAIPGLLLHASSENTLCTGNRGLAEKKNPFLSQATIIFLLNVISCKK
jgi:hypothetical protein